MYYVIGDISEKPKNYDTMSEAVLLWRCADPPEKMTRYGLTAFSMTLNEITPGLRVSILIFGAHKVRVIIVGLDVNTVC
jgi:hypothetical protein